ncbi:hydroxylase [Kitasatospora griseola]|uniref:Hydroxylase n=1 Tax=Kitasatospora griseola TaxID=2064 RepID=A0A0D0P117_KITGR|nr:VOC family protein [Kitasatospora griseola]KIQ65211.1 hydroxylase [Kitasatospora griseola]
MKTTDAKPGAPCWVELSTKDPVAARTFYHELFGWRTEAVPEEKAMGYTRLYVGDRLAAGLVGLMKEGQPTAWNISFHAPDVDATAEKITAGGGSLIVPPTDALDWGRFTVVRDPAGAVFSAWQPRNRRGCEVMNEPGSLGWIELATRDPRGAVVFYRELFDWTVTVGEMYTQFGLGGRDFGGMMDMADQFPPEVPPYWMPYFAVADVDLSAERAALLGATVTLPPTDVPDGPRLAVLRDPQGAAFGIHVAYEES